MKRKPIFDAIRRLLGRGLRQREVVEIDAAIDAAPLDLGDRVSFNRNRMGVGLGGVKGFILAAAVTNADLRGNSYPAGLAVANKLTNSATGTLFDSRGDVTQATSNSTSVTLNTARGTITMHNASLAANTPVGFLLVNNLIDALVTGTRISTIGATLSITGTDNAVTGCAIAVDVEFGAGATNCKFAASPIAAGHAFTDNSGNSTNRTDYTFIGSKTFDPISPPAEGGETTTVTCTGAKVGMFANASFSQDLQGMTLTAYVSATNTVTVRFQNGSGGTVDLASGTFNVQAFA